MVCDKCSLEQKVKKCCGEYPETGEIREIRIRAKNGKEKTIYGCVFLTDQGYCSIFNYRPDECRNFECNNLRETDLVDIFDSNSSFYYLKGV